MNTPAVEVPAQDTAPSNLLYSIDREALAHPVSLITSGSSAKPWGGKRKGAGRPADHASIRSLAEHLNRQLRRKQKRWTKTKVWEIQQIEKVHPALLRFLAELPPGRGQRKYRKQRDTMVPNAGPSRRTLIRLGALPYSKQFTAVSLFLFGGDVPDEIKPLFEADDETLRVLAQIAHSPDMQK